MRVFFQSISLGCLLFVGSSLFATNGNNLIATGTKSRGMGGVGIAKSFGAESGLANPALISTVKNMEVSGSLTFFGPDVSYGSDTLSKAQLDFIFVIADSNDEMTTIPEISFAQRINEDFVYGVSVTGTAAMGVDYSEEKPESTLNMKTNLQLLKISIPLSYQVNSFAFGFSPVMQFGTLEMSHITLKSDKSIGSLDNGPASDTSIGFEMGMAYDFNEIGIEGLSMGLVYKSKFKMSYDNTISALVAAFNTFGNVGISSGDNLDQPAEIGLGFAYVLGEHTLGFDYRKMNWEDASGFSDFGWEDQDVYAIGYAYKTSDYTLRAGLNYAKSPIKEQDGSTYSGAIINSFNLAGFPGIVEKHYTIGMSFFANDEVEIDLAMVYANEVSASFDTSEATQVFGIALNAPAAFDPGIRSQANVTHSQFSLSVGATYKF